MSRSKTPAVNGPAAPLQALAVVAGAAVAPPAPDAAIPAADFRKRLGAWYRKHARELPWRGVNDPYATWLSEIMLQQTRVATVMDRYVEFLRRFPTLRALAKAHENEVLALWSGLGYYRRARMLHRGAQFVERELDGKLPHTSALLRTLPGVGEYTAAAIASIAFGESIAVVDGNVERVLLRIMGLPEDRSARARAVVMRAAQSLLPPVAKLNAKRNTQSNPPGEHNQAMMELGATICLPKAPLCLQCPVFQLCRTRGEHPTPVRQKQQSRIVAHLLVLRKSGTVTEVLLERRAPNASLMPDMLELPPLPIDAARGREPVLRVRHAITNTNYYAQIFSEGATSAATPHEPDPEADPPDLTPLEAEHGNEDEAVFVSPAQPLPQPHSLLQEIPAALDNLAWFPTARLADIPLTGLARKVLQRLGVMQVPELRLRR